MNNMYFKIVKYNFNTCNTVLYLGIKEGENVKTWEIKIANLHQLKLGNISENMVTKTISLFYFFLSLLLHFFRNFLFINFIDPDFISIYHLVTTEDNQNDHSFIHSFI